MDVNLRKGNQSGSGAVEWYSPAMAVRFDQEKYMCAEGIALQEIITTAQSDGHKENGWRRKTRKSNARHCLISLQASSSVQACKKFRKPALTMSMHGQCHNYSLHALPAEKTTNYTLQRNNHHQIPKW